MSTGFRQEIERAGLEHQRLIDDLLNQRIDNLERVAEASAAALDRGGKLLFFGNGGSAAQAQEMAGEFVNRYSRQRRALAAVALTVNTSVLTSIGNDLDFREIFSRQIEALGRPEDVAIGISTSGASENVVLGLQSARALGIRSAAFVGNNGGDGGPVAAAAELVVRIPARDTARIQEIQMFAGHLLCRWVEHLLGLDQAHSTLRSDSGQAGSGQAHSTLRSDSGQVKIPIKLPAES